jgi:Pyrimidine dimer DNA glycosylase
MNIFAVSRHPRKCARALDDKRLNKMILETAQILCTVINEREGSQVTQYRSSHVNHPITKWAMSSDDHVRWLYDLGIAYGKEIMYRFGRKHACHLVLEGLTFRWPWIEDAPEFMCGDVEFHNGARHKGLGLDFTHLPVHEAYREYLKARWPNDKRKPVWTKRSPPSWR